MSKSTNLITISRQDLDAFELNSSKSKIGKLLTLVLSELPQEFTDKQSDIYPYLSQIEGFEDDKVRGYEVKVAGEGDVEKFIKSYIPFFILEK